MAIVLGLVAAYIVRQAMQKPPVVVKPPPKPPAAPAPQLVPVVFANANLPKHSKIGPSDIFIGYVKPEAKAATGTFKSKQLAEGRITIQTIRAGQAIRDEYLLGIGEALPDLASRIPAGHRAVTINIEGADTGGKRLEEGDHIDIAMSVEGSHPALGEVLTRTLLRNVLVVDAIVDKPTVRVTRRATLLKPDPSTITVAVPPEDVNKLLVAERTGTLVATLLSDRDIQAGDPGVPASITRRELLGLKDPVPPRKFMVEKWTGTELKVFEMSENRIRESREVTSGRREDPVEAAPAPPADNRHTSIPSGVISPYAVAAETEVVAEAVK
jgi:pilus assembly protein CpaB